MEDHEVTNVQLCHSPLEGMYLTFYRHAGYQGLELCFVINSFINKIITVQTYVLVLYPRSLRNTWEVPRSLEFINPTRDPLTPGHSSRAAPPILILPTRSPRRRLHPPIFVLASADFDADHCANKQNSRRWRSSAKHGILSVGLSWINGSPWHVWLLVPGCMLKYCHTM